MGLHARTSFCLCHLEVRIRATRASKTPTDSAVQPAYCQLSARATARVAAKPTAHNLKATRGLSQHKRAYESCSTRRARTTTTAVRFSVPEALYTPSTRRHRRDAIDGVPRRPRPQRPRRQYKPHGHHALHEGLAGVPGLAREATGDFRPRCLQHRRACLPRPGHAVLAGPGVFLNRRVLGRVVRAGSF